MDQDLSAGAEVDDQKCGEEFGEISPLLLLHHDGDGGSSSRSTGGGARPTFILTGFGKDFHWGKNR